MAVVGVGVGMVGKVTHFLFLFRSVEDEDRRWGVKEAERNR